MTDFWSDDDAEDGVAATTAPPLPDRPLMSTNDVAELFDRSPRTIRQWVQRGLLTPVRVGGAVFFRRDDIDAMVG